MDFNNSGTISLSADGEYTRSLVYLGRAAEPFINRGQFDWDARGGVITLGQDSEGQAYQVGENLLFHLDREGRRITGDLADRYLLKKVGDSAVTPPEQAGAESG